MHLCEGGNTCKGLCEPPIPSPARTQCPQRGFPNGDRRFALSTQRKVWDHRCITMADNLPSPRTQILQWEKPKFTKGNI